MVNYDLIERHKNKILNFGVIILAIVIALRFQGATNVKISSLTREKNNELEKNKVLLDISVLEKKATAYKKVFVKKDLASIVGVISGFARETSVKVISIKPSTEEIMDNYVNFPFLITLTAPSYSALGNFISKIENYKDIYMVGGISINSAAFNSPVAGGDDDLSVSLKINAISYL